MNMEQHLDTLAMKENHLQQADELILKLKTDMQISKIDALFLTPRNLAKLPKYYFSDLHIPKPDNPNYKLIAIHKKAFSEIPWTWSNYRLWRSLPKQEWAISYSSHVISLRGPSYCFAPGLCLDFYTDQWGRNLKAAPDNYKELFLYHFSPLQEALKKRMLAQRIKIKRQMDSLAKAQNPLEDF